MTVITDSSNTSATQARDRRRSGRPDHVSPELLPLLRQSERDQLPFKESDDDYDPDDQLSAARGVFVGVALSVPLWVGAAYVVRWLIG
jgi:hypothetical protein